jgi:N-acyl-D-amino-acid deacylase
VEGKRLGSFAAVDGTDPWQLSVRLLRRNQGNVGMVGFAMSEQNLERILAHPLGMVCSDGGSFATEGPARRGNPHPRGLGTYPRVLGRYVRERKALTLADAIRKMSLAPASRAGIRDRARLTPGFAADVVVFDPRTVEDKATFEQPYQYPAGIRLVLVKGRIALRDGDRAGTGNGRSLRFGS